VDITRLEAYYWLDAQLIANNFMKLYLEGCGHKPAPEELINFAADRMGMFGWKNSSHQQYNYLLYVANKLLDKLEDNNGKLS
jgi:hypothetical protein